MIICEYIISQTDIIGIGPIMVEKISDQYIQENYNRRKLWFLLILKQQAVKVESPWLDVGFGDKPDEYEKKARAEYQKFAREYEEGKLKIIREIGERLPVPSAEIKQINARAKKAGQKQKAIQ